MKIKIAGVSAMALALSVSAHGQSAAKRIPIEHFTRFDQFLDIKISPDGETLAYSMTQGEDSVLAFVSLKDKKGLGALSSPKRYEVDRFDWVSNTRLIYTLSEHFGGLSEPLATGEIFAVDRDLKNKTILYGFRAGDSTTGTHMKGRESSYAHPTLVSTLRGDDKRILISEQRWLKRGNNSYVYDPDVRPTLNLLDVYTGTKKKLGMVPLGRAKIVVDNDDQPRFAVGIGDKGKEAVAWRPSADDDWKAFEMPGFREESVSPLGFSDSNEFAYFTAVAEKESLSALYRINLKTQGVEKVFAFANAQVDAPVYDLSGRRIVGVRGHADGAIYHWFDEKDSAVKVYSALTKAFPKQSIYVVSSSDDGKKSIVKVASDTNPGDYYLFDSVTMKADYVQSARSWLDPQQMRPKEPFVFKARDGLELHGYVTKPAGTGPFPLVVLPHGGPHTIRDHWNFEEEVQLLANRGYAVLQVNFRGSAGYGISFVEAGYREWGRKMQDDLTDATKWAIDQKISTADRICIYGASYGGYAALMGAVREPKLYQCAIGYVGVYDLELLYSKGDTHKVASGLDALETIHGTDPADLHARSPVYNAEKIEAPVLLIHGKEDWRADFEHAKRMRAALEKANKQYEWLALSNEGHGVYDEESRKLVYERILAFLDKHLAVR